jgi:hypothetical protein
VELECIMRWELVADRAIDCRPWCDEAMTTQSGRSGRPFHVVRKWSGRIWAADQRELRDTTGRLRSTNPLVITRYNALLQLEN